MENRIEVIDSKLLVGMRRGMSLAANETAELWRAFMQRKHEVKGRVSSDYISMQVYPDGYFARFSPVVQFEKWAAVEVSAHESLPYKMEAYELVGGKYAVFAHKGPASGAPQAMQYIFGEWLPKSEYELDSREHFEVLPENYSPVDPEAEEEIWIPVR